MSENFNATQEAQKISSMTLNCLNDLHFGRTEKAQNEENALTKELASIWSDPAKINALSSALKNIPNQLDHQNGPSKYLSSISIEYGWSHPAEPVGGACGTSEQQNPGQPDSQPFLTAGIGHSSDKPVNGDYPHPAQIDGFDSLTVNQEGSNLKVVASAPSLQVFAPPLTITSSEKL